MPMSSPRMWTGPWDVVVVALLGGVWGGALARVAGRLWPLGAFNHIPIPAWVYSPAFVALLGLCGAVTAPYLVGKLGPGPAEGMLAPHRRALCFYAWPLILALPFLVWPVLDPWWAVGALAAGVGGAVWLCRYAAPPEHPGSDGLLDGLVFVGALTLYLSTMAPSVLPGDSGEFQFVTYVQGIPHPTGYPLYLVLGKLFSLLPIGSVAYRLNLFSGVAAAGAVWMTWRACRTVGLSKAASLVGAALLMVSETFWTVATVAEKYALNAFFVSLTLWLALRWRQSQVEGRTGRGWLAAWAVCYGLSLTHHRTMVLLAPAYLWLFAADRSIWRWRTLLRLGLLGIAPLSLYLILPLFSAMNPPYAYVRVDSLRSFLDLVFARSYQGSVFQGGWDALPGRVSEFIQMWARQFGPLGLLGGLVGLGWFLARHRRVGGVLLIGMGVQAAFALNYYVPNTVVYYLPVYTWWAVCMGGAVDLVYRALSRPDRFALCLRPHVSGLEGGWLAVAQGVWTVAAMVLPLSLCAARWSAMDRQRAYVHLEFDHTYGQTAIRYAEPGALVVSDWLPATVLWYRLFVEEPSSAIQVAVADPLEYLWPGYVENALQAGRAVYLARPLIGPGDRYVLSSAGPLVRVRSVPEVEVPPMSAPLEVELSGGIRLLGSDLRITTPGPEGVLLLPKDNRVAGGSRLHVTIYWQANGFPAGDYAVTVRLVDAAGHVWLERQNRHPVGGTYPTSRWQPRQVVADYYDLVLPADLASGAYHLSVSVGLPFAEENLSDAAGRTWFSLMTLDIQKPLRWARPALGTSVRRAFGGGMVLTGVDAPRKVVPGETVSVALQWLVGGSADYASRPRLTLVSRGGTQQIVEPVSDAPEDWVPGALVVDRYTYAVPDGFVRAVVRGRHPWGWGTSTYRLSTRITSVPPPLANFGGLIRLQSYAYERDTLSAGETVHLDLRWEAVRPVNEPYKVFVHVLGQNGLPVAQQDHEPVNGTYPTDRWRLGERIVDPYDIVLPEALSPGEYQVEVGLYRASDFYRLPVVDQAQVATDDKVLLAPLTIR